MSTTTKAAKRTDDARLSRALLRTLKPSGAREVWHIGRKWYGRYGGGVAAIRPDVVDAARAKLRRAGGTSTLEAPNGASRMGRKRKYNPDPTTPAGQLALYLQHLVGDDATKIAAKTGLSRATIFNYIGGTSSPSIAALNKIAKALGKSDYRDLIPPDDFVDGIGGNKRRKR